jgi:hypothetical protein
MHLVLSRKNSQVENKKSKGLKKKRMRINNKGPKRKPICFVLFMWKD